MVKKEMEGMAGQICIDTSVCIEIIKGNSEVNEAFGAEWNELMQVSAITVFELLMRKSNLQQVEKFVSDVRVLNFDEATAKKASEIEKELQHRGTLIGREDIFIAATAMANNCALATLNAKDFSKIKGLKLVKLN